MSKNIQKCAGRCTSKKTPLVKPLDLHRSVQAPCLLTVCYLGAVALSHPFGVASGMSVNAGKGARARSVRSISIRAGQLVMLSDTYGARHLLFEAI